MAAQIQGQERQGEVMSRQMEMEKQSTLLGMAQQDVAAYQEQAAAAEQAKWSAIQGGVSGVTGMLTGGVGGGGGPGGGGMSGGGSAVGEHLNAAERSRGGGGLSLDPLYFYG
jgi:hypothetical protein